MPEPSFDRRLSMCFVFARCDDRTLQGLKEASRSENAAKVVVALKIMPEGHFPAGADAPQEVLNAVSKLSDVLRATWDLRMDAQMTIDGALGVEFSPDRVKVERISPAEFAEISNVIEKYVRTDHQDLVEREARILMDLSST